MGAVEVSLILQMQVSCYHQDVIEYILKLASEGYYVVIPFEVVYLFLDELLFCITSIYLVSVYLY